MFSSINIQCEAGVKAAGREPRMVLARQNGNRQMRDKTRPDLGLGFRVKVVNTFKLSPLRSEAEAWPWFEGEEGTPLKRSKT